jgi:hypothetical protein
MAYTPAERARDYHGARIYAEVTELLSDGEKFARIKETIRNKFGTG